MPLRIPRSPLLGVMLLILALLPAVAAVWWVPGFVTQDGPAHVYNAHILLESLRLGEDSPFAQVYEPRWRPLPNLGGHLTLIGLLAILPPVAADRAMTTLSMVGFALAILWLRWRVAGTSGLATASLLAALLALNMPWLMGFSNFLLGAILALITWGLWWEWKDRLGPGKAAMIGGLLVLGYFGHLVSLGLTVGGVLVLAALAPGNRSDCFGRLRWTLVACLPLVPLALLYKALTAEGGAFEPVWEQAGPFWSPSVWVRRLSWVDPITLGRRDLVPLMPGRESREFVLLSPSLWLGLGLLILIGSGLRRRLAGERSGADRTAWAVLSGGLWLGAMLGPDGFGDEHGYFLTQRLALMGLACLLPALELNPGRRSNRLAAGLIFVALVLQSAFVWDYAMESDRRAGAILQTAPEMGRGHRVGTLLIDIRGRYRSNPLLHADCLLGVGSGHVIWSNYETRHYYFPVQLRSGVEAPPSAVFEKVAILDDPANAHQRALLWADLLRQYGQAIDLILIWGRDPTLEAITAEWAGQDLRDRSGAVQIVRRKQTGNDHPSTVPSDRSETLLPE